MRVATTCSSGKAMSPIWPLQAASLRPGSIETVSAAWLANLPCAVERMPACELYRGRGFGHVRSVAEPFVISAGLGLVKPEESIPSYSLTVSAGTDDIFARINGRRDPAAWWRAIRTNPFSTPMDTLFDGSGIVLMALSAPYLAMVADELEARPESDLDRLRIFLPGSPQNVPQRIARLIMPYDDRMNAPASALRGPLTDFAPRALRDFAGSALEALPDGSAAQHAALVAERMAELENAPSAPRP